MKHPRWALTLAGALLVAGCAATAVDVAPTPAPTGSEASLAVTTTAIPLADDALRALAAMHGPYAEDGTMGEGCDVDEADALPDGAWFGVVSSFDEKAISFDVACVYGPDTDQYLAFAQAETAPDRGYAVVNDVANQRSASLTEGAGIYLEALHWSPTDPAAAHYALDPEIAHEYVGVWVVVEDGDVVAIVEPASEPLASE